MQLTEATMMQSRRSNSDLVAEGGACRVVVDGRFLLDIDVAGRDISLRLVVVVVRDEVLDGIMGEERS